MQVISFRLIPNAGNLKADASVQIGQTKLHGFNVIQQPGQRPYVSPPKREWTDHNQKKQYGKPLVELPEAHFEKLQELLLERYRQVSQESGNV